MSSEYESNGNAIRQALDDLGGCLAKVCDLEAAILADWDCWFSETAVKGSHMMQTESEVATPYVPFAWEESRKLVSLFLAEWELFAASVQELARQQGVAEPMSQSGASGRPLEEVLRAPSYVFGRLFGQQWDQWRSPEGTLQTLFRNRFKEHAGVCREVSRRKTWWTADSKTVSALRSYLTINAQPVPVLPWSTLYPQQHQSLQERLRVQLREEARNPDPKVPEIKEAPSRVCWGSLRDRYASCLREAEALRWESRLLDQVVTDAEEELPSFEERQKKTCLMSLAESKACTDRCGQTRERVASALSDGEDELLQLIDSRALTRELLARSAQLRGEV